MISYRMATFEEIANAAQRDNEYQNLYEDFLEVVETSDPYRLCHRIHPFLSHVNDGGNLSALSMYLQGSLQNPIITKGMVHNVVNASKTNPNLKRTLEILIG